MKRNKKILSTALGMLLVLNLTGCSTTDDKPVAKVKTEDFDTYVQKLPAKLLNSDNMNLEFMFETPKNYGFKEEILNLPYSDKKDYEESAKEAKKILKKLKSFNYEELNEDQKLTYDILVDSLESSIENSKYYYLDNSYLGSFVSFQAQLPLLLSEYTFERKNDLDSYFNILATSEKTFLKYAEIEKERQKHKSGLSKNILEKTIEQCKNYTANDDTYLIERINQRIDQVTFLNDKEKAAAKQKNQELVTVNLKNAYKGLQAELEKIEPTNKENKGLAFSPKGKEYYEDSLQSSIGMDMSVKEVKEYLKRNKAELFIKATSLVKKHPELAQSSNLSDLTYSDFTSVAQTLDYLKTAVTTDYPKIDNLNYEIITVPDSMKDNFSPAAYLQGKIDAAVDTPELIYINGDYSQGLFGTIEHEGYPGHMYQHSYFKQQKNIPTVRYLIDYKGYSEGWATYVEWNGYKYAPAGNQALLEFASINSQLVANLVCEMDIGINYDGWSYDEYVDFWKKNLTDVGEDAILEQYNLFLETPTNYLQYYLSGFLLQDLYDQTKSELGDKFSPVKFHEVILKTGPAPYEILEKQVNKYINKTK